jgi:hypothetical protein
VLNLHVFRAYPDPVVNDVAEYGGYRSPRDHPEQKIWHHRRQGNLAYLARVPYSRDALRGRLFGLTYRLRWWLRMHERFFRPTTYALKARKILSPRP